MSVFQAAMADGSVDEEECRGIFRKFDDDGSGELDTKELTKVIVSILEALRNKVCGAITRKNQKNAHKAVTAVQESFKEQIAHYKSPEGEAELAGGFDPDSDGSISEEEFLESFPAFMAFLIGGDPSSPKSTPASSPKAGAAAGNDLAAEPAELKPSNDVTEDREAAMRFQAIWRGFKARRAWRLARYTASASEPALVAL